MPATGPPSDAHDADYGDFPLKGHLGLEIEHGEPGTAIARIALDERHLNPNGVAHGAVLFAMVDTAMGAATMSLLDAGRFCATVDIRLNFIRPAAGGTLSAHTTVIKKGKAIVHLESRVTDDTDRLIATAAGTFAIVTF
ncbi:MAG: PaaI family thioesterase [Acidimicrobiales bacterium]